MTQCTKNCKYCILDRLLEKDEQIRAILEKMEEILDMVEEGNAQDVSPNMMKRR